jgi:phage repressor protein C with HTH and peptisase S24 domain
VARDLTISGGLNLDGPLCGNAAIAGCKPGEVGKLYIQNAREALLATPRKLLVVRGEVHRNLPSGSFTSKITSDVYQVKGIYQPAISISNQAMDIRKIRQMRLRQLIDDQFGGVDAVFAGKIGRAPSYIARMFTKKAEHHRNISEQMAREIESICGLEPAWLDRAPEGGELELISAPAEAVMGGKVEVWGDETPLPEDTVAIPFLKEVELSAGSGRLAVELNEQRRLRFGKYSLRNQGIDPANARCVSITGNSMEPVLRNNSTVGVDLGNTRIIDGDMYAVNHGGQLRVKQVYRLPGGGLRLRSFNRDEHPDEEYSQSQVKEHDIVVLGRVFWSGSFH